MVNYLEQTGQGSQLDLVLAALAHDKRRGIVYDLALRPATVSQMANQYNLSLPAIHKHIRILEQASLIARRKIGRTNFLAFRPEGVRLVQEWAKQFNTAWASDSASLENYLSGLES